MSFLIGSVDRCANDSPCLPTARSARTVRRTADLDARRCETLYRKVIDGQCDASGKELFRAQMLTEFARMNLDDDLVMQLHPGSFRNHNPSLFERFGRDKGADIPQRTSRVFSYSMSKAAVHNLSRNLAREWGTKDIRVNTLVPGFFPAGQNRKVLDADRVRKIMGHTPMQRFGNAKELCGATLLLASDAGSFITGAEILVDGGYAAITI